MKIISKEKIIEELTKTLKGDSNVLFAFLYGSILDKEKFRDVDVGIYFGKVPEGMDFLVYTVNLTDRINYDVDVIVLNKASAFMRNRVLRDGMQLFISDYDTYGKFREKTFDDYQE
jgi:uncharacterized protein